MTIQNPRVDAGCARAFSFVVQNRIDHRGDDREVALLQAPDHLLDNRPRLIVACGFFYAGTILVVNGLPIQSTRLRLPVFVAYGGPDFLEGIEIELGSGLTECCERSRENENQTLTGATAFL